MQRCLPSRRQQTGTFESVFDANNAGAIGDNPGQLKAMLDSKFADGKIVTVIAESDLGKTIEFQAAVRIDTPQEILYYQHGGILQYVLRQLAGKA